MILSTVFAATLLSLWLGLVSSRFIPAKQGCSMSHCDPQMSDNGQMMVPQGDVEILWTDRQPVGSPYMVGCSSNGRQVACSFGPVGNDPFLKAYDGDGNVLWSFSGLGRLASVSAPMIDARGRVIACDSQKMIMLENDGSLIWEVSLPGGIPVSPVVTENGLVIVATTSGYIFGVDSETGEEVGGLEFTDRVGGKKGSFPTINTPLVEGNRIYTVTMFAPDRGDDRTRTGRVFAVDVDPDKDEPFELIWTVDFGSRSGASPTLNNGIIFFDGDNPEPNVRRGEDPHFFGIEDMGTYGKYVFRTPVTENIRGSPAADPFGRGIWFSAEGGPLTLLNTEGKIVETVDVENYEPVRGTSKYGIATFGWSSSTGNPVAMFTAGDFGSGEFFHVGIDVVTKELVYSVKVGDGIRSWSTCQAATVLDSRNEPVVVIITAFEGVVALGRRHTSDS